MTATERYNKVIASLEVLIAYGHTFDARFAACSYSLATAAQRDAMPIFSKQLAHAVSLRKLLPTIGSEGELWDIGSACAVARCLIEAYDTLAYFSLEPVSDETRQFRNLLATLHDQERRTKMLALIGSNHAKANQIANNAAVYRERVIGDPLFKTLSNGRQAKVRRGDAPDYSMSQEERNAAGGIDHRQHQVSMMFLSQYVHSMPMAISQWRMFEAGTDEALQLMLNAAQYALPYFAKGVAGIERLFPWGRELPVQVEEALRLWMSVAEHGVPGRG